MGAVGGGQLAVAHPAGVKGKARWLRRSGFSWTSITRFPRRRGIDVLTAQQAGRCGFADTDQLGFATAEERVLVTFDSDFLALHQSGVSHAGIVWCPQQKYGIGMLVQLLELLHGTADREKMRNRAEYL